MKRTFVSLMLFVLLSFAMVSPAFAASEPVAMPREKYGLGTYSANGEVIIDDDIWNMTEEELEERNRQNELLWEQALASSAWQEENGLLDVAEDAPSIAPKALRQSRGYKHGAAFICTYETVSGRTFSKVNKLSAVSDGSSTPTVILHYSNYTFLDSKRTCGARYSVSLYFDVGNPKHIVQYVEHYATGGAWAQ